MGLLYNAVAVNDELPSASAVQDALALSVQDEHGTEHTLRSLLEGYRRTIVVFVRHNGCGMCHRYVSCMAENAAMRATESEEQRALPKDQRTHIVVIGHGTHEGIKRYKELSGNMPFDMYVDTAKHVYTALGMSRRNLGASKNPTPEYLRGESAMSVAWQSAKQMVSSGTQLWKGGDIAWLGGDVVLNDKLQCIFIHRMEDTVDHTSVDKLAEWVEPKGAKQEDSAPVAVASS